MPTGEIRYRLKMDEFSPSEYNHVIVEAQQLVDELNNGDATLPGELEGGAIYAAGAVGTLFLVLGIDRPLPVSSAEDFQDELEGLELAFASRFDGSTVEKLDAYASWQLSGPGLGGGSPSVREDAELIST